MIVQKTDNEGNKNRGEYLQNVLLLLSIFFSLLIGFIGGVPSQIALIGFIVIIGIWLFYTKDLNSVGITKELLIKNALLGATSGVVVAALMLSIYLNLPEVSAHFFQLPLIFSEKTGIESKNIIKILFPISYILGSLLHELFYRGFLQGRLSKSIKPVYSILLVAGLFGWGHFPEGIYSMTIGFYEGVICGILFHKTGSIISPWSFRVFHMVTILIVLGVL